jgi:hypothetical protein
LSDDLPVGLLPKRDPANMIRMRRRENRYLIGTWVSLSKIFLTSPAIRDGGINQHASGRSLNQIYVAGSRNHENRVIDLDRIIVIQAEAA